MRIRGALLALVVLLPLLGVAGSAGPASAETTTEGSGDGPGEEPGDDAAAYIGSVFELFLDRPATAEDVERWRPTAEWGDRSALTGALAVSDEWAGTRVDELYTAILGRPSDPAGRAHWVGLIASGSTLERVAAFLYGSDEYYRARGSTVGGFVESLYRELLGRPSDPEGHGFWVEAIRRGAARSDVASGFHAAIESRGARVTTLYAEVLGRTPEPAGHRYWSDRLRTVGDVSLAAFLASSSEFFLRATGNPPPDTPRAVATGFSRYASVGAVTLTHPAAAVERVGFHESGHDGSQQAQPAVQAVRSLTMATRYRGTGSRTAADIVVPPDTEVRSPVTGRVLRAGTYRLYCRYRDDYVVVEPDARPGWEVKVFHIDGVQVSAGERVEAGVTRLAPRATVLPFASQVDRHTAEPSWPHVHVEVVDPSIPDRSSGSC